MVKNQVGNISSAGFTLLETLVVLIIIGILSAIAAPTWLSFIDIQRLRTGQDEIHRAMREAQRQSVKDKITWQVSFREKNNVVQWTTHPTDASQFIPIAIQNNDSLWHNLEPNVRIYQSANNLGKRETTFVQQTSPPAWRVMFNYQGCPVYKPGDECTNTSLRTLGQITLYSQNGGQAQRCVYISTIIGAMRTGQDHDVANSSGKYCY